MATAVKLLVVLVCLGTGTALDTSNLGPPWSRPGAWSPPNQPAPTADPDISVMKQEMSRLAGRLDTQQKEETRKFDQLKSEMSQTSQAMQFAMREITNRLDRLGNKMSEIEEAQKQATVQSQTAAVKPHTEHAHTYPVKHDNDHTNTDIVKPHTNVHVHTDPVKPHTDVHVHTDPVKPHTDVHVHTDPVKHRNDHTHTDIVKPHHDVHVHTDPVKYHNDHTHTNIVKPHTDVHVHRSKSEDANKGRTTTERINNHRAQPEKPKAKEPEEKKNDDRKDNNENDERGLQAQIKACGRPPMTKGQTVEVTAKDGKILATYSCAKGYALIDSDSNSTSYCTNSVWSPITATCNTLQTCGHVTSWRMEYNGTVSVTKSGKKCQAWGSVSPHRHRFTHDGQFWYTTGLGSETVEQASNYCRDPGMMGNVFQVWCYTTDPKKRWEKCDVPACGK